LRDGAPSESGPAAIESGRIDVDGPLSVADAASDPLQAASENGATNVDATLLSSEVGTSPDTAIDITDVGAEVDGGAGSEASTPTGCAGQDLYVDVSDGHSTTRLVYSRGSSIPLATGNEGAVTIAVSQNPNWGGAIFSVELNILGPQSATTRRVFWTPAGQSATMNDRCGSGKPVTITRFDVSGGILEGDFDTFGVGYSCEGIEATLNGHFRVCYVPPN